MNRTTGSRQTAQKVVVAMSGGVDSSVAAMMLLGEGCEVTGITFRLPHYGAGGEEEGCCGVAGIRDARRVCYQLGIRHFVLDYRGKFEETVLNDFLNGYSSGRTPNPCIRCNDWLKFGFLLDTARLMDADAVATGHYVRKRFNPDIERWELRTGKQGVDQSYFLFSLSQDQLAHALFPLGGLGKDEVRSIAREAGLEIHDRPKSQDLCFLAGGGELELLREKCPQLLAPGEIVHVNGRKLGRHRGLAFHTVGQRKGLGIAWKEPLYVVKIDPEGNRLFVGEKRHVRRKTIMTGELNWVSVPPPEHGALRADVKIRYRHPGAPAGLHPLDDGRVRVEFDEEQTAPAPGQAAVFYRDGLVLGGGFIEKTCPR